MLTDKYIVPRNKNEEEQFAIYRYLGLRNRPQQASTRSYVRRTVELIVEQMNTDVFQDGLTKMTEFLDLKDDIVVYYDTAYTTRFFTGNLQTQDLDTYFNEIELHYKKEEKTAPFKVGNYNALRKKKNVDKLVEYVNELVSTNRLQHIYRSSVKKLNFNITNSKDHSKLKEEYNHLDNLRKIGLLKAPAVKLAKKGVSLQNVSSGEFHFFSTTVGLLATIENNSLVLIDEPEISLHPNWQMKYLSFLREIFSGERYSGTQFIIATHSHFLISDLNGNSGNILGLKKKDGKINSFSILPDTYGWSAEEVLYKIFDVRTTRNYYLEIELRELLHRIATKDKNKKRMKEIVNNIEEIEFSDDDPLNIVINRAKTYLND